MCPPPRISRARGLVSFLHLHSRCPRAGTDVVPCGCALTRWAIACVTAGVRGTEERSKRQGESHEANKLLTI